MTEWLSSSFCGPERLARASPSSDAPSARPPEEAIAMGMRRSERTGRAGLFLPEKALQPGDEPRERRANAGTDPGCRGRLVPRRRGKQERRADVIQEVAGKAGPVDRPRRSEPVLELGDPLGDLLVAPASDAVELHAAAVIILLDPGIPPGGLSSEPLAEPGETVGELSVAGRGVADELPRPVDPFLGEGPNERGPVHRVQEVVGDDVVRELGAVRQLDRVARGGRRRRPRPCRRRGSTPRGVGRCSRRRPSAGPAWSGVRGRSRTGRTSGTGGRRGVRRGLRPELGSRP